MINVMLIGLLVIAAIFFYIVFVIASYNFMKWLINYPNEVVFSDHEADPAIGMLALIWPFGIPLFFAFLLLFKMIDGAIYFNETITRYFKRK